MLLRDMLLYSADLPTQAHTHFMTTDRLCNHAADLDCRRQVAARAPAHAVLTQCEPLVQVLRHSRLCMTLLRQTSRRVLICPVRPSGSGRSERQAEEKKYGPICPVQSTTRVCYLISISHRMICTVGRSRAHVAMGAPAPSRRRPSGRRRACRRGRARPTRWYCARWTRGSSSGAGPPG